MAVARITVSFGSRDEETTGSFAAGAALAESNAETRTLLSTTSRTRRRHDFFGEAMRLGVAQPGVLLLDLRDGSPQHLATACVDDEGPGMPPLSH